MSPERYGPSRKTGTVLDLLPRTKVHTPLFLSLAGIFLVAVGGLMVAVEIPSGDLTAATIAGYRAGGWTSFLIGAVLLREAVKSWRRRLALAKAEAERSPGAWKLDHSWTPGESRVHAFAAGAAAFVGTALSLLVGGGALHAMRFGGLLQVGGLLLAAGAATGIYLSAGALRRGLRFGENRLRWEGGGPLRPGTLWNGTIEVVERVTAPYAHLQYIKEKEIVYEDGIAYGRREHDRVSVVCRIERGAKGQKLLRLAARIPADAPSTFLSRIPARYWELVVADDESGWLTSFLVPLYS